MQVPKERIPWMDWVPDGQIGSPWDGLGPRGMDWVRGQQSCSPAGHRAESSPSVQPRAEG